VFETSSIISCTSGPDGDAVSQSRAKVKIAGEFLNSTWTEELIAQGDVESNFSVLGMAPRTCLLLLLLLLFKHRVHEEMNICV
jgi:hypothetical protein